MNLEENINNIINKILELEKINIDDSDIYIFDTFNELLINNKYKDVNYFLKNLNINDFEVESLISILTITYDYKYKLPNRNKFYNNVKSHLKLINENDIEGLIGGLN